MNAPAQTPRVVLETPPTSGFFTADVLGDALSDFAATQMRANHVEPVVTELVRLRCAQIHDCRLCSSLRSESAANAGVDEEMTRRIASYETSGFAPAVVAALRLCDAIILSPQFADDELADELAQHFSDLEVAEICLDIMKWSHQKVAVSLRLDGPRWDGLARFDFDADGQSVLS